MNRYSKSPTRNTKPQVLGDSSLQQNDKTFINSMIQKLWKPGFSQTEVQALQKQLSNQLCKQFKKSETNAIQKRLIFPQNKFRVQSCHLTSLQQEYGQNKMMFQPIRTIFKDEVFGKGNGQISWQIKYQTQRKKKEINKKRCVYIFQTYFFQKIKFLQLNQQEIQIKKPLQLILILRDNNYIKLKFEFKLYPKYKELIYQEYKKILQKIQKLQNFYYSQNYHSNLSHTIQKQPQQNMKTNSLEQLTSKLQSKYQIKVKSIEQFKNSYNLILLAYNLIYDCKNTFLQQKLIQIDPLFKQNQKQFISTINSKAGNNVILLNALLKHIKSDPSLSIPLWIKQLTFFNILEDQNYLCKFIDWMIEIKQQKQQSKTYGSQTIRNQQKVNKFNQFQSNQKIDDGITNNQISSNRFRNIQIQNSLAKQLKNSQIKEIPKNPRISQYISSQKKGSPLKPNTMGVKEKSLFKQNQIQRFKTEQVQKQENSLQNLFFASNLKQKISLDDQIMNSPQKTDKIVRKGSFKLLKPKAKFTQQNQHVSSPKQLGQQKNQIKQISNINNVSNLTNFQESNPNTSHPNMMYEPEQLKQISMIEPSYNPNNYNNLFQQHSYEGLKQIKMQQNNISASKINKSQISKNKQFTNNNQNRKTVPKNLGKPPIHRNSNSKNKQNLRNSLDNGKTNSSLLEPQKRNKKFFNNSNQKDSINSINHQVKYQLKHENQSYLKQKEDIDHPQQKNPLQNNLTNRQNNIQQPYQETQIYTNKPDSNPNISTILQVKNHYLKKQLNLLQKQIKKQQKSNKFTSPNLIKYDSLIYNDKDNTSSVYNTKKSNIDDQIINLQSQKIPNNERSASGVKQKRKSQRKILKINILVLSQQQKINIISWLKQMGFFSLNQRQESQIIHQESFIVQQFKNGVKLIQICNRHIGRGTHISFFSNPNKNAQIHANFSKLIDFLKKHPLVDPSEKCLSLQLFVPIPQQNSIWSLLNLIYKSFSSKSKHNRSATKSQQLIYNKNNSSYLQNNSSSIMKKSQREQKQQQLQYSNQQKNNSFERGKTHNSRKKDSVKKHATFNSTIQFVSQIPQSFKHTDLIQNEQPECNENQQDLTKNWINQNTFFQGYKERYLRKALINSNSAKKTKYSSLQTPKKITIHSSRPHEQNLEDNNLVACQNKYQQQIQQKDTNTINAPYQKSYIKRNNFINSSSKKSLQKSLSRIQSSSTKLKSTRKNQHEKNPKLQKPKVTLNMQMKINKLLKSLNLISLLQNNQTLVPLELFKDPIRNGTLVNLILSKIISNHSQIKYYMPPKSIQNCKENYLLFFRYLKNKYGQQGTQIFTKYQPWIEQILKGDKTIFYGILFDTLKLIQIQSNYICDNNKENINSQNIHNSKKAKQQLQYVTQVFLKNPIQWIRFLQTVIPSISQLKIRDLGTLYRSLTSGIFFYNFTQNPMIRPVYPNPTNFQQKQINVKKVITYLVQNKLIFLQNQSLNIKSIVQQNQGIMKYLLEKLIIHSLNKSKQIESIYKFLQTNKQKQQRMQVQNVNKQCIALSKYLQRNMNEMQQKKYGQHERLQTTTAQNLLNSRQNQECKQQQPEIEVPWLRKIGFSNCSLSIKNGILLCRLISKLTRTNIKFNQNLATDAELPRPQCLGNIRKALKLIPNSKYDQIDVYQANYIKKLEIIQFVKDKFKNTYQLSQILKCK